MTQNTSQVTQNQPVNARPNGQTQPTMEEFLALKQQLADLQASSQSSITYKCHAAGETYTDGSGKTQTGKGAMSMSGLGRFPVTLYKSQWVRLIAEAKSGKIDAALARFSDKLAVKS